MRIIIDVPEDATQGKPWDYARQLRDILDAGRAGINSSDHTADAPIRSEWVTFEIGGGIAGI